MGVLKLNQLRVELSSKLLEVCSSRASNSDSGSLAWLPLSLGIKAIRTSMLFISNPSEEAICTLGLLASLRGPLFTPHCILRGC